MVQWHRDRKGWWNSGTVAQCHSDSKEWWNSGQWHSVTVIVKSGEIEEQ